MDLLAINSILKNNFINYDIVQHLTYNVNYIKIKIFHKIIVLTIADNKKGIYMFESRDNMVNVSIIVPIYNAENSIELTIDSILNQNYKDFELILINDGSKDNSGLICNRFAAVDKRIKVIHQNNSGAAFARNIGIKIAKGKYIAFVDADDILKEDWLSTMIEPMMDHNTDLICTWYKKIFKKNKKIVKSIIIKPEKKYLIIKQI